MRTKHGANAYGVKTYSYQYIENTYAISKYALRHVNTANFSFHDTPSDVSSTPGFRDAGFDNFSPAYEDWMNAETLLICGTDPYETKTILWTQWIMKGIQNGQKCIMMNPRRTAGVAYAEKNGGLWLDIDLGTDLLVVNAIARIIAENGWQDAEWIKNWVNNKWGSSSGFGQGTRNTPWQWRTTWGKFQTDGYEDWKKWLLSQDEFKPENAAKIAKIDVKKIYTAAEWMAKPTNGKHPKTSIMVEKGFYWSNNTGNTQAISALGIIVGGRWSSSTSHRPRRWSPARWHKRWKISTQQVTDETSRSPSSRPGYRYLDNVGAHTVLPTLSVLHGYSRCVHLNSWPNDLKN